MYSNRQRSAYRAEADYNATPHQDTVHQALAPKTYRLLHAEKKHAACSMQHTTCTSCRASTANAKQTYSLPSKAKNIRASAGTRR